MAAVDEVDRRRCVAEVGGGVEQEAGVVVRVGESAAGTGQPASASEVLDGGGEPHQFGNLSVDRVRFGDVIVAGLPHRHEHTQLFERIVAGLVVLRPGRRPERERQHSQRNAHAATVATRVVTATAPFARNESLA